MDQTVRTARVIRVLRWVRDTWLILGATLLIFLLLEAGTQGVHWLRGAVESRPAGAGVPEHPYAHQPWWAEFQGPEGLMARRNRFDPYRVHWSLPMNTPYIHIDSAGQRLTIQPRSEAATVRRIVFLGGSTMWGYTARDSFTIPSLTAARLKALGVTDFQAVNLAQAAYNSTQEANTLWLELAQGRTLDVAVFLDGYNDIVTAFKYGEPGHTYGDEGVQEQIRLGNRGFWQELLGLGRHSLLVQDLSERFQPVPERNTKRPVDQVCGSAAEYYERTVAGVEALGKANRFTALFFLQPMQSATRKKASLWEQSLRPSRKEGLCAMTFDSLLSASHPNDFQSLTGLFDADTTTVFVDDHAHVTETANRAIAERIAERLAQRLGDNRSPR